MRNIRVFFGAVVMTILTVLGSLRLATPNVKALDWPPLGKHPGMQYAADGRPKFMVKKIDFVNNEIVFAYLKDGEMESVPKSVGVAWFEMERYWRQDTSQVERMDDGLNEWTQIVEARYEDWEEVDREGDVIYYKVGNLERNLGNYDPTGKWMYYLRFDDGTTWTDGNTFWNARVDYTQCIIEYRDVVGDVLGHEGLFLIKAECLGDYNERGEVEYTLVTEFSPEPPTKPESPEDPEPTNGGAGSDSDPGSSSDPSSSPDSGSSSGSDADSGSDVDPNSSSSSDSGVDSGESEIDNGEPGAKSRNARQEDWAQLAQAESGEYRMTVTRNGENEVMVFENTDKETKDEEPSDTVATQDESANEMGSRGEMEVPELGGVREDSGWDKTKRWLVPVMAVLALGVMAWWLIPIILRRRKEKEGEE